MIYNEEARFLNSVSRQIISEAYFGRTKEVQGIIDQIGVIREKAGVKVGSPAPKFNKYNPTINTWPEVIQLNRLLENMFGFQTCSINVVQDAIQNAWTFPISGSMDNNVFNNPRKMVVSTKTGFKYKKEAKFCLLICITSGLLLNSEITNEEITAVLFHEIGHNFSTAMDGMQGGLILARIIINWMYVIVNSILTLNPTGIISLMASENWAKRLNAKLDEVSNDFVIFKGMKIVGNAISTVFNAGKTVFTDIILALTAFNPVVMVGIALQQAVQWPLNIMMMALGGNRDEQYADSFCGIYGLGAEQASALAKMTNGNQGFMLYDLVYNKPVIGHIANFMQFPVIFMSTLFESHPNLNQRCNLEIELCENELKKTNLDPKMKVELQKQLADTKKVFKQYCDTKERLKVHDPRILQRQYEEWLASWNGGGIRNSIFDNKTVFNRIDDTYEEKKHK